MPDAPKDSETREYIVDRGSVDPLFIRESIKGNMIGLDWGSQHMAVTRREAAQIRDTLDKILDDYEIIDDDDEEQTTDDEESGKMTFSLREMPGFYAGWDLIGVRFFLSRGAIGWFIAGFVLATILAYFLIPEFQARVQAIFSAQ